MKKPRGQILLSLIHGSLALMMLLSVPSVVASPLTNAASALWPTYNNGYDGQRFSPLKQINTKNVAGLKRLCEVNLGELGASEAGPIVIGRTIYVTTLKTTVAVDAANCSVRWRHIYEPEERFSMAAVRGAAYHDGIIVRGTTDARLIALDAETGRELWRVKGAEPKLGQHFTSAPIAWNGLVFIGTSGSEWGLQSRMMAFDIKTGKEVWRFNLIPQDGEPGAGTWLIPPGAKRAGAGTWSTYTLDTATGEIFVPTGNPAPPLAPDARPGINLYTNSIVSLDAMTGKLRWFYQTTPADPWDYDQSAAPVIYQDSGKKILVAGSKDGHLYGIDRDTHQRVFRTEVTTINDPGPMPTEAGILKCPGTLGGVAWNGPAFDPLNHTVYVGSTDWCTIYKATKPVPENVEGIVNMGGLVAQVQQTPAGSRSGWVHAVDASTGTIRWKYHVGAPMMAAITPTAGGLVFGGDLSGNFFALDAESGRELYKIDTGGSMAGGVATYAVDKKQYVAFMSGSMTRGFYLKNFGTPRLVIMTAGLVEDKPRIVNAAKTDIDSTGIYAGSEFPAVRGSNRYQELCVICHGSAGEGASGPALKGLAERKDASQIESAIKSPGGSMPKMYPGLLKDQDVSDLVEFIKTLQ